MDCLDYTIQQLLAHRDHKNAVAMAAYMKNNFAFLGIKSPERKALQKDIWKKYPIHERPLLLAFVETLWAKHEREFQYVAMDTMWRFRKFLINSDTAFLEKAIITKSWWDSVDFLAGKLGSYFFYHFPESLVQGPEKWVISDNKWLIRGAILFQLNHKDKTDEKRLFSYIRQHKDSNEFFIQKAIGWALRQYGKVAPEAVRTFVAHTELKPLSKREALKHIG